MSIALRPIFINIDGELAQAPSGAILDIGGVLGPNFFVNGKPLLFADGTATDGSVVAGANVDLQAVYNNSGLEAFIQTAPNKDITFRAVNGNELRFDGDTGLTRISGDLQVQGTIFGNVSLSSNLQTLSIRPTSGLTVPFIFEPAAGFSSVQNLIQFRATNGGPIAFSLGPTGTTTISSLVVGAGGINGINITQLASDLSAHLLGDSLPKHNASQISVDSSTFQNLSGNNVQEALESIDARLDVVTASNVRAYEHIQVVESAVWVVNHGGNSKRLQVTVWDEFDEEIFSDGKKIINPNTVEIYFNTPITGRAIFMLF